ncbi:MAG TPA: DUF533 domain-containing protein, partial [Gemmatimonadaceae bacterium]|nr:DUF533 domain-containing protein [Gemmatimonadaceae bacterium]
MRASAASWSSSWSRRRPARRAATDRLCAERQHGAAATAIHSLHQTPPMSPTDAEIIITIAAQAAVADGNRNATELAQITAAATRLGLHNAEAVIQRAAASPEDVHALAESLSSDEARRAAYEIAVAVCNANGVASEREVAFLQDLSLTLGTGGATAEMSAIASVATLTGQVLTPPVPPS